jgi:heme-degrading monooxygenase HmoA
MKANHIIRVFQATAKPGNETEFTEFFINEALPMVMQHEGLISVQIGLPRAESGRDFLMTTTWRDLEALKGFAGEDWREAIIDPREAPLLESVRVYHYHEASL